MRKILKNPWLYLIIMVVLIGVFYINNKITGNVVGGGEYDEFAQYLTAEGVKMYGTEWCSHCKNQKELFGNSFQYIDYIDCDRKKDECLRNGVKGYPTWIIEGIKYPGEQRLGRLADLTECELTENKITNE